MKTENTFEVELECKLSDKKFESVLQSLQDPTNHEFITSHIWNIINTVCLTLKTKELIQTDTDLNMCRSILLNLVDRGNPKEVIVALMEEADTFKSHEYFCLLLDPLKETLKKVPGKRGKSLEWVLSSLNAHIQTLRLPEDLDLQGEEKLLLDTDPAVIDANFVLKGYHQFVEAFVDEVGSKVAPEANFERVLHQREILQKFILILLDHPFLYHDLHALPNKPKSTIRTICENYLKSLSKISGNVFKLFRFEIWKVDVDSEDCDRVSKLALANLAYLIFVENLATSFQPFVLSPLFLFCKHLKYATLLLDKKENLVLFKGLHLAQALLNNLDNLSIAYEFVELDDFTKFPKLLLNVAVYSQIEVHRKMSIVIFLSYVEKCDWRGRYHILLQALLTANHSGAESLAVCTYKKYLHECLSGIAEADYFLGNNLKLFVKKALTLKDGVETDILENSDRIMASLNLLRYLLLRDKREINMTGTWDLLDDILETFVEPLKTGLDLSRAHYKQVEIDHENDRKNKKREIDSSITINNESLSNLPPHFEKEVFNKAFLAFDMIESVMSRLRELF